MPSEPLVLGFDTSAAHCAAALLSGDSVVAARVESMGRGQAERLMVLLEEVLTEAGVNWKDLSAIGVGVGPGNFTGIRISVSAARGLALGLGIPAVGVSLFETTRRLADWAQVAVPAPREQMYFLDPDKMTDPILAAADQVMANNAVALSSEFGPEAHVREIAKIAAERASLGSSHPAPAPLYIKPADAAPPRDPAPVILDDA